MTRQGFAVVGEDHLGHGESAMSEEDLGYFGKGGNGFLMEDIHQLRKMTTEQWPDIPYFMLGHSMGSFLLAAGAKGKRFCLPHSKVMIHQPSGGAQGQQTEIEIVAEEIKKTRRELNQILSDASGQPIEKVQADTERDNYLTAAEALDYGLIDRIVTSRDLAAKDA